MKVGFIGLGRMGQGMARGFSAAATISSVFDAMAAQTDAVRGRGRARGLVDRRLVRRIATSSSRCWSRTRPFLDVAFGPGGLVRFACRQARFTS